MRSKMLILFAMLWGCGQDAPERGGANEAPPRERPPAEAPPTEAPPVEEPPVEEPPVEEPPVEEPPVEEPPVEEPPVEEPPVEEPSDHPCDTCIGRCVDGIKAECHAVMDALDPAHQAAFGACYINDPCNPDQTRTCLEGLACDADLMIGQHCDALARCSMDGRGWLDEASCRALPYSEPLQWACLAPERRDAIGACLQGQQCGDLEVCVRMAACGAEGFCPQALATRLAVDCYRVCQTSSQCHSGRWGGCYAQCDQAALRLADEHRRSYEACALEGQCGTRCLGELACDTGPLSTAMASLEARCGAQAEITQDLGRLACLGHVIQTAIMECFDDAACGDVVACVQTATCGDTSGCLDLIFAP